MSNLTYFIDTFLTQSTKLCGAFWLYYDRTVCRHEAKWEKERGMGSGKDCKQGLEYWRCPRGYRRRQQFGFLIKCFF